MGNWKTGAQQPAKTRGPERSVGSRNANKGQSGSSLAFGWFGSELEGSCNGGARPTRTLD